MTTLLIDGDNIAMRATHAMRSSLLASANGVPTGAVMVFINMLSRYVRQVKPDRVVICWDGGRSVHRTEVYPDYKSTRKTPDAEWVDIKDSAFDLIHQFCALAGFTQDTEAGFEADDLIAHYWHRSWLTPLFILSGDKDLLQLVTEDCTQIRPGSTDEWWTPERVQAEMGCSPASWGDVLALSGDQSDGVPGVPRVGVKTACKDLAASGWNLERLIADGPDRYRTHEDIVRRNVELVELRHHGPQVGHNRPVPRFVATATGDDQWPELLIFLNRYELFGILGHLLQSELWEDQQPRLDDGIVT